MKSNIYKGLSMAVAICLLISLIGISAYAKELSSEESSSVSASVDSEDTGIQFQAEARPVLGKLSSYDIKGCFTLAQSVLTKYYRSKINIVGSKNVIADFSSDLASANLNTYIEAKINSLRQVGFDVLYSSFSASFELIDSEVVDGTIHLTVAAHVVQPYYDDGIVSEFGEHVQFIFTRQEGNIEIADWYLEDAYDINTRGLELNIQLNDPYFWYSSSNTDFVAEEFDQVNARIEKNKQPAQIISSSSSDNLDDPR
jgi:hypothetical protein